MTDLITSNDWVLASEYEVTSVSSVALIEERFDSFGVRLGFSVA
ncbi:hypothetical protein [Spongiibacter marinus]